MVSENSLVSVIIPVYKVERYLDACVESVVAQTYRDLEIIIVDDGSPDNCPAMCDAWAVKDSRIRVIHRENGGLSAARNSGMDVMHGDYVTFVDSDDVIEPDMINTMVEMMLFHKATIAVCASTIVDESGLHIIGRHHIETRSYNREDALHELLYSTDHIPNTAWGKMYDASLFTGEKKLRFPEGLNSEDYYFNAIAYWRSNLIYVDDRSKYRYRKREGSICTTDELSPHSFDKIAIAELANNQLVREGYADANALSYHLMLRCYDVLFTLLQMGIEGKVVRQYTQKLRDAAVPVYSDSTVSMSRKTRLWAFSHFPKLYYRINSMLSARG